MKRLRVLDGAVRWEPLPVAELPSAEPRLVWERSVLLGGGRLDHLIARIVQVASGAGARTHVLSSSLEDAQRAAWLDAGAERVEHVDCARASLEARAQEARHARAVAVLAGTDLGELVRPSLSVHIGRAALGKHGWDLVTTEVSDVLAVAIGAALASK